MRLSGISSLQNAKPKLIRGTYTIRNYLPYIESGKSMRKIAEETGISFVSIFHSLKEHKKRLRELFKDDYENLKQ